MLKITLEEIIAAKEATGLSVVPGSFLINDGKTCALSAFCAFKGEDTYWLEQTYGHSYITGFWRAFDGYGLVDCFDEEQTDLKIHEVKRGYDDGKACRSAIDINEPAMA